MTRMITPVRLLMTKGSKTKRRRKLVSIKITDPRKLTQASLRQDHNKVESVTLKLEDDDIVVNSIQKIVNEILEDIADIFVREKLFTHECKMILIALDEKIKKT